MDVIVILYSNTVPQAAHGQLIGNATVAGRNQGQHNESLLNVAVSYTIASRDALHRH